MGGDCRWQFAHWGSSLPSLVDPRCPFPLWVCRSVCSHRKRYPGTCPWDRVSQGVQNLSWKTPTCSSQHLVWPEAGYPPALSKATDKLHTFLYFVMFLDTSSSSLYVKPGQPWPQTAAEHILNVSRSIFWIVCLFACFVFSHCSWEKAVLYAYTTEEPFSWLSS